MERLPEEFGIREMMAKSEEKTPYTVVAIQECERMNMLTNEIRRSLKELDLGLKVNYKNYCGYLLFINKSFEINLKREN